MMNEECELCYAVIDDDPDIKIILFTSHDLAIEASREPTIDTYLQKKDLNKLLPTVLRLLGMDSPAK